MKECNGRNNQRFISRRDLLYRTTEGIGGLALAYLLGQDRLLGAAPDAESLHRIEQRISWTGGRKSRTQPSRSSRPAGRLNSELLGLKSVRPHDPGPHNIINIPPANAAAILSRLSPVFRRRPRISRIKR